MNRIRQIALSLCIACFSLMIASNAYSQNTGRLVLVSDIKVETGLVDTPIFKVMNVPEKPWKQRKWIEIDVDFTTAASRRESQRLDNVTVSLTTMNITSISFSTPVLIS